MRSWHVLTVFRQVLLLPPTAQEPARQLGNSELDQSVRLVLMSFCPDATALPQRRREQAARPPPGEAETVIRRMFILSNLTLPFVADGSTQLLLALRGFPKAVGVKVDARAAGVLRRPAAEHGVAVISPAVVDPILRVKVNT